MMLLIKGQVSSKRSVVLILHSEVGPPEWRRRRVWGNLTAARTANGCGGESKSKSRVQRQQDGEYDDPGPGNDIAGIGLGYSFRKEALKHELLDPQVWNLGRINGPIGGDRQMVGAQTQLARHLALLPMGANNGPV